jgi:small conductance mechanosensitive channel
VDVETRLRDLAVGSDWMKTGDFIVQYGEEILTTALMIVAGLIAVKFFLAWLRKMLPKFTENAYFISTLITSLNILLTILIITFSLHYLGFRFIVLWRLLVAICLVAVGFVVLLRPYIPTLPFKIGNTVEIGGLIGKVEAMTFTYTRLKTFEGKTLFIPNQIVFKTIINNFNFTPTRRVRVKVGVGYKDDLLKAKKVLKEIMESDSRVLKKPVPAVYVMELGDNAVMLSARCWVENAKYLRVLSDVTEKVKMRFDEEGISIPFPQREVHVNTGLPGLPSPNVKAETRETAVS